MNSQAQTLGWIANPFLHVDADRVYNPLTDRYLAPNDPHYDDLRALIAGQAIAVDSSLADDGWVIRQDDDLSKRSYLKIVSLETMTTCNQKCYFCPVSVAPREDETMPAELFARILGELQAYRATLEGVFLQSYNEPTVDRNFVDNCRALAAAKLPIAVLTNGSGLTPAKVDALIADAPLRYLCVNLSTLDRERYQADRGEDHLDIVLRNLNYASEHPPAAEMRIVVLGKGDDEHQRDFEAIRERFAGSRFDVARHVVRDRAGWLDVGMKTPQPIRHLGGCDNLGSRPIQHLHITPAGKCILCCNDYDENYVVGDLNGSTIEEVLRGEELARMRRWVYGVEEAPDDFICRNCVSAKTRPTS